MKNIVIPQLGKVLIGKYARVAITQLIGIYLWEYCLASTDLVARVLYKVANPTQSRLFPDGVLSNTSNRVTGVTRVLLFVTICYYLLLLLLKPLSENKKVTE